VDAHVVIHYDNISNILLANKLVYHTRTKHIKVHYHFIKEKIIAREINLIHVNTNDQVANIFTKAFKYRQAKEV